MTHHTRHKSCDEKINLSGHRVIAALIVLENIIYNISYMYHTNMRQLALNRSRSTALGFHLATGDTVVPLLAAT